MTAKKQLITSLRIISLFTTAIIISTVPDYLRDFLGDSYCSGWVMNPKTHELTNFFHYGSTHEEYTWHWGWRHWLFCIMGICLSAVQIYSTIIYLNKKEKQ